MSDEMVERVARIMWAAFATEGTYDEDRHDDREAYLAAARAAIAAMREPTEAMVDAAYALHTGDRFWDETACPPTLHTKLGISGPIEDYHAMIDAALNSKS